MNDLTDYLKLVVENGASDLHLSVGASPCLRIDGQICSVDEPALDAARSRELIVDLLTDKQRSKLEESLELDFAINLDGVGRFRGNAHFNRGGLEAAFRHIPDEIPKLETLGLPPVCDRICEMREGLVLVTGVTGSGKSTTLAAMVDRIAKSRRGVIVTVEDPIEFIFTHQNSLVKQREVGNDTLSFAAGLKHVLRQDPDVIVVSELRDLETIQTAITAAETGHLVIGTLHTIDAPKALDRLIDVFPGDRQGQIVAQLANALQAVISQRLLPHASGKGRVLASEVMLSNNGVQACIRQRRSEQLLGLMEISQGTGMQTIDQSLLVLLSHDLISFEEAMSHARDPQALQALHQA